MVTPTILLVDDEGTVRSVLRLALEDAGYAVLTAASGPEALELFEDGKHFDLLLTDIDMPKMNGLELARRLTEVLPGLPVMFITGYGAELPNTYLSESGIQGSRIIRKPFLPRTLLSELKEMLPAT